MYTGSLCIYSALLNILYQFLVLVLAVVIHGLGILVQRKVANVTHTVS